MQLILINLFFKDAKKAANERAIEGSAYCFQSDQQAVKLLPKVESSKAHYKQKLQLIKLNFWFSKDQGNMES